MPITYTQDARQLTAALSGELDHHAAKHIMTDLQQHIDAARPRQVILDLAGVTFTDSSGIAVLLRTMKQADSLGASMGVIHTPSQARRVFQAAGLDHIIPFD